MFSICFHHRKDYENHMLQSRLHFRIHSALQEIKHKRKLAKNASKLEKQALKHSKKNMNNNSLSPEEDAISISIEDPSNLDRQDSSSSFETAPENSDSEDGGELGQTDTGNPANEASFRETTV